MANDADLFGDSSSDADTDDLIAAAKSQPIAKKKGGPAKKAAKKKDVPDADNDSDDDDLGKSLKDSDDEKDDAAGLFDSSSEDEGGKKTGLAKKKKKLGKKNAKPKKDTRSMKERMEALAKKRGGGGDEAKEPKKKRAKSDKEKGDKKEGGYESGDSYDSATFQRTKDDDDFIDADGEDPEALKELYAEQHFDDERPDGSDSEDEKAKKKKSKGGSKSSGGGVDKINLDDDVGDENADATSALVMAVKRMAKKKKETKKLPELELEATEFLKEMEAAADADEQNIANRKPATKKLVLLPKVLEMLAKKDLQRPFLDLDLLATLKKWVQPLPNGSLGNVTLRKAIFDAIAAMSGENGITSSDLKRSGFGKVTMALYMHKSETPAMKKLLKSLIDQWSRPIFQKSGDMRDLEKIQAARGMNESGSLTGMARSASAQKSPGGTRRGKTEDDLAHIISEGSKNARDSGNNRVRVPYSKGFQFTVRPTNRTGDVSDKRNLVSAAGRQSMGADGEKRNAISKRMLEKNRPVNKQNLRSANISIEGRATK